MCSHSVVFSTHCSCQYVVLHSQSPSLNVLAAVNSADVSAVATSAGSHTASWATSLGSTSSRAGFSVLVKGSTSAEHGTDSALPASRYYRVL